MLWREHDWRVAIQRLAVELAGRDDSLAARAAAVELGRACEYIEPDRRRAIEIYGLACSTDHGRAVELAVELGWWPARARLVVASRAAAQVDVHSLLDEAEAWWDADQPELCALALAGVRNTDSVRVDDLAALLDGDRPVEHAVAAARRAAGRSGNEAAESYVTAARFARVAGATDKAARFLEAALAANPHASVAASSLLAVALASNEPATLRSYLRTRLDRLEPTAWIDGMRASAFAMIETERHRGFGLRLLRRALERVYELKITEIPGHLAMWIVLAAHAAADGNRRELLPLALSALQSTQRIVDRVWLAALSTEISLREAASPIVAGAYAEIVAEHAPEHPIVRELVSIVARFAETDAAVPPGAVAVATAQLAETRAIDDDRELPAVYVAATETALNVVSVASNPGQPTRSVPALPMSRPPVPSLPPLPAVAKPPPASTPQVAAKSRTIEIPVIAMLGSVAAKPLPKQSVVTRSPSSLPAIARVIPSPPPRVARRPTNPQPLLEALRTRDRPQIPTRPPVPEAAIPRSRRIAIPIDVRIVLANGTTIAGHSRDVSTSGLFVLAEAPVAVGDELTIELSIPGKEAFTEVEYRVRARVARRDGEGIGIELVAPEPALLATLALL